MNLMNGNKPPTPSPNTQTDGYGMGGGNYMDRGEKKIIDIVNDDEEAIMLVIQGFISVNQFKRKYRWDASRM